MLAVVVTLEALPGKAEEMVAALEANAVGSRTEPGCLKWEWSRHLQDPHKFAIYELYTGLPAFEEHKASEHFAHWKAATGDLIAEKVAGQYEVQGVDPRPVA